MGKAVHQEKSVPERDPGSPASIMSSLLLSYCLSFCITSPLLNMSEPESEIHGESDMFKWWNGFFSISRRSEKIVKYIQGQKQWQERVPCHAHQASGCIVAAYSFRFLVPASLIHQINVERINNSWFPISHAYIHDFFQASKANTFLCRLVQSFSLNTNTTYSST